MHVDGGSKEPAMNQAGGQGSSLGMAPLSRFDHVVSWGTLALLPLSYFKMLTYTYVGVIFLCLQLPSTETHNSPHNPVEYNSLVHNSATLPEARGSDSANSTLQSQGSLGFTPSSHLHMARNQQGGGGGLGGDSWSRQSGGTSPNSQPSLMLKPTQLPANLLQGSSPQFTAHHAAMHASGGQFVGESMQKTVQPNAQQVNMYQQQMRQSMQPSPQQHPYYMQVQMHPNLVYRQQPPGNMPMYADGYLPASPMQQGQVDSHLGTMLPGSSMQPAPPPSSIQPMVESSNHSLSLEHQSQPGSAQQSLVQQGQTQQQPQPRTRNIIAIIDPKTGLDITKARRDQGSPTTAPGSAAADQPSGAEQKNSTTDTQVPEESSATPKPAMAPTTQDPTAALRAKVFYDMVAAAAGKSGSNESTKPKTMVGSSQDIGSKPSDDLPRATGVGRKKSNVPEAPVVSATGKTADDAGLSFGNFGSEDLPPPPVAAAKSGVVASDLQLNAENQKLSSSTTSISLSGVVSRTPPTGREQQPKEEKIVTQSDKEHNSTGGDTNSEPTTVKNEGLKQGIAQQPLRSSRLMGAPKPVNVSGDAATTLIDKRESEALPPTEELSPMKVDSGLPMVATTGGDEKTEAIVKESVTNDTMMKREDSTLERRGAAPKLDQMKTTTTTTFPSRSSTDPQTSAAAAKPNRMVPPRSNPMDFSARSLRPGGGGLRPGGSGKVTLKSTSGEPGAASDSNRASFSSSPVLCGVVAAATVGSSTVKSSLPGKIVYTVSELKQHSAFSERPPGLPSMDVKDVGGRGGGGGERYGGIRGNSGGSFRGERFGGDVRSVSRGGAVPSGGGSFSDGRSQCTPDGTGRGGASGGHVGGESHGVSPGHAMGGGPDWKRGQRLPPHEKQNAARGGGDAFDGLIEPLKKGENRWKPTKDNTLVEEARKKMQGILNKMTRERFDRLNQQLIDIKIESLEMLNMLVRLVFDKAVEEHHFVDMYADLCFRLVQESSRWSFVKAIYNMDANQWCWTPDVGKDKMVMGPFSDIEKALEFVRNGDEDMQPIPTPFDMELVAFRIFSGKVIKIMQGKELSQVGQLYIVYMDEKKGRKDYQISEKAFGSEDEALQQAAKMTALRTMLLIQCQIEFEKDDIYEHLVKEEKEFKASESSIDKKLFEDKMEEFAEKRIKMKRRMVGNILFIGELYKKELLKENIIHKCCCKLLNAKITEKGTCCFINSDVDEEHLECLCKLLTTTGKKVSSAKQGKRVAEYFRLLDKICKDKDKRRVSSRIIFMVRDLSDLRANDWTPRHKVEKAKTLDELHKQAASDERNKLLGGMGGRNDSGRSLSRPQSIRDRDYERDRERDRIRQGGSFNSSPGTFQDVRNTMTRGDSGRGVAPGGPLTRTSSGNSVPSSSAIRDRGGRGGGGRQQQQQQYHSASLPSSHSLTSQVPPNSSGRVAYPSSSSAAAGPGPASSSTASSVPTEKTKRLINTLIDEFLSMRDVKEAVECLKELPASQGPKELVHAVAMRCMDGKPCDRPLLLQLMTSLFCAGALDARAAKDGLFLALEQLDDICIDQPQAPRFLAELLAVVLKEGKLEMKPIVLHSKETCSPPTLGKLFATFLKHLLDTMGLVEAKKQLNASGFNLPELYASKGEGMQFLHENNLWAIAPSIKLAELVAADPSAMNLSIHSALAIVEHTTREVGRDIRASDEWADSITQFLLMKSVKSDASNIQNICRVNSKLDLFKALKRVSSEGGHITESGCLWGAYRTCTALKDKNQPFNEEGVIGLFKLLLEESVVTVESYRMWRVDVQKVSRHKEEEANAISFINMVDPIFSSPSSDV